MAGSAADRPFYSGMSVSEFALLDAAEARPVADVVSAAYSSQPRLRWRSDTDHDPPFQLLVPQADDLNRDFMCQLETVERWWEDCVGVALARLAENAGERGANAVLDVAIEEPTYVEKSPTGNPGLEVRARGTAVRRGLMRPRRATLAHLSAAEWQTLDRAGWQLAGLVTATACMFVAQSATIGAGRRLSTMGNRDLEIYADLIRAGSLLVRQRLEQRAAALHARGVLGVRWHQSLHEADFEVGIPRGRWPTGNEIWRTRKPEHASHLAAGLAHVRIYRGDGFVRTGTIVAVTGTGTAVRHPGGGRASREQSPLGSVLPVLQMGQNASKPTG